jgi:hypothetical protein
MITKKNQLALRALQLVAIVVVAAGCPGGGGQVVDTGGGLTKCEGSDQCPTGHVCVAGACVLGTCDALLEPACDTGEVDEKLEGYCCKPWEQCSTLSFTCENDPDVKGIGCDPADESCTPCQEQSDCAAGQFCSGASCFDATGRDPCTSSFQCPGGQRCDRTVFLCVPDRGGCTFCGPDFPELCCEEGQICSQETGFCTDVAEPECEDTSDCGPGLQCDELQRCVQCVNDDDCGPGLACDEGTGNCFSLASQCESDADCQGAKRCATALQTCVIPECQVDGDCDDSREKCNLGEFRCFLPPAVCTETDEANNSAATATPLVDGNTYSGTLCRGDFDFLSFPVQPNKRYTATVDFGGSGQAGISVVMLDTNQVVESSAQFSSTQSRVQVAGVTGDDESGEFFLKVTGSNQQRDSWTYTVTVAEDEPSPPADCTNDQDNEDFATATPIVLGQQRTFSRCGTGDADFYRIPLSRLNSLHVEVRFFNAEGNLNAQLFKAANAGAVADTSTGIDNAEILDGVEGPTEYYLKVFLGSTSGALTDQTYTITATEVPRPTECAGDINEDDGLIGSAVALTLAPDPNNGNNPGAKISPLRCNAQDADLFRFTMPANLGGVVLLRFDHNLGDMALDLLDIDGNQLTTSNVSNANSDPDEQVTVPGSTSDVEYIARARLAGSTGGTLGQPYTLEVQTFDNSQCISTEPNGGDDTLFDGRCVGEAGDFTGLAACDAFFAEPLVGPALGTCNTSPSTLGCGLVCGNGDSDWYRVGTLNNDQVLHATLTYDPTKGPLAIVRGTVGSNNAVTETTTTDSNNDGFVELAFTAPRNSPKEYGVKVKPQGTTGHQLEPYTLTIEVGGECTDDANDVGTAANEKPSTATTISRSTLPADIAASRCSNDVDVYELIVLDGESITLSLDQDDPTPTGLQAELGLRPSDLTQIPPAVVTAAAGAGAVQFSSTDDQVVYITVRPAQSKTVTGGYTLHVAKN